MLPRARSRARPPGCRSGIAAIVGVLGISQSSKSGLLAELGRLGNLLMQLQQIVARQRIDEQVIDYAVRIVRATREWAGFALGSGSRGALALVRGARAVSIMQARNFVTPDDIKKVRVSRNRSLRKKRNNDLNAIYGCWS